MKSDADDAFGDEDAPPFEMPHGLTLGIWQVPSRDDVSLPHSRHRQIAHKTL